jgi:hypothetical protein
MYIYMYIYIYENEVYGYRQTNEIKYLFSTQNSISFMAVYLPDDDDVYLDKLQTRGV